MRDKTEITLLLIDARNGSDEAYDQLFSVVYDELKRLAYASLNSLNGEATYSATALVHEAYLRLIDQTSIKANDSSHFFAIASKAMHHILIDRARRMCAQKRGGDQDDVTYVDEILKTRQQAEELLDLDQKLKKLKEFDERLAEVVELRFFGNMTIEATATALNVSASTVKRDWAKARGWLYNELGKSE